MQQTCKKRSSVKKCSLIWQSSRDYPSIYRLKYLKQQIESLCVDYSLQKYSITMTSCFSHPSCPKIIRNIELSRMVLSWDNS